MNQAPDPDGHAMEPSRLESTTVLPWFLRLRWGAVFGQAVAVLFAHYFLKIEVPFAIVIPVIGVTVFSNLLLLARHRRKGEMPAALLPGFLILDTLSLTCILLFTGGSGNPFSALYVVHVILAVIVLRPVWTWIMIPLSIASFGMLFLVPSLLDVGHDPHAGHMHGETMGRHLVGMWVALSIAMVLTGYFSLQVLRALRRREEEAIAMRDLAARNARIASLTTLTAGVAHELGSPLATIAVAANDLESSFEGDSEARRDVRLIREEVDRCRSILDRMHVHMLESSSHEPQSHTLAELLSEVKDRLGPSRMARVRVDAPDLDLRLPYPLLAISQSAVSLITNALEASAPEDPVDLVLRPSSTGFELSVVDRGAGIRSEILDRVDEPFFTTKESGAGLGLFLTRAVVEHLGGRIVIEPNERGGTRVRLLFPAGAPA